MGNNAPAALHRVVGIQGRLRRLHAFFVLPFGWFGAFGATYCLWLLMGKQCACGATRGWWRDRVAFGDYMLFCFYHSGGFGACGATYCWLA